MISRPSRPESWIFDDFGELKTVTILNSGYRHGGRRTAGSGAAGMDPCVCIRLARLLVYILTGGSTSISAP